MNHSQDQHNHAFENGYVLGCEVIFCPALRSRIINPMKVKTSKKDDSISLQYCSTPTYQCNRLSIPSPKPHQDTIKLTKRVTHSGQEINTLPYLHCSTRVLMFSTGQPLVMISLYVPTFIALSTIIQYIYLPTHELVTKANKNSEAIPFPF